MKKLILAEFIVLLIGTIFAWSNFGYELYLFLNWQPCTTGCALNLTELVNPIYTPCFYGAIFFTAAFVLSAVLLGKSKNLSQKLPQKK